MLKARTPAESPETQILSLAFGHLRVQVLAEFARLGIADLLRDAPKTAEEIAASVQADTDVLTRILNYLCTLKVVSLVEGRTYSLAPLGRTLCSKPTSALKDNLLLMATPCYWDAIGNLQQSVRTGKNAFTGVHQVSFFEHLSRSPDDANAFNAAMNSSSSLGTSAVVSGYDFSRYQTVVDVAGGRGALLKGILEKHSSVRGVLFDSETVLRDVVPDAALADRLTTIIGSFFDSVPSGGDLYILRRILHNWDDDHAVAILRRCREAMTGSSRLLLVELAAPETDQSSEDWATADLLMMILFNGRERTKADFERILPAAGFRLANIIRSRSPFWFVEADPA
jgi:hypothetical protein